MIPVASLVATGPNVYRLVVAEEVPKLDFARTCRAAGIASFFMLVS